MVVIVAVIAVDVIIIVNSIFNVVVVVIAVFVDTVNVHLSVDCTLLDLQFTRKSS